MVDRVVPRDKIPLAAPPVRLVRPWPDHFFSKVGVCIIIFLLPNGYLGNACCAYSRMLAALGMASPSSSSPARIVLGDTPHQPKEYNFPKQSFGKKTLVYRRFQSSWFTSWKWLHYLEAEDITLCFLCLKEKGVVVTSNLGSCDQAFVSFLIALILASN